MSGSLFERLLLGGVVVAADDVRHLLVGDDPAKEFGWLVDVRKATLDDATEDICKKNVKDKDKEKNHYIGTDKRKKTVFELGVNMNVKQKKSDVASFGQILNMMTKCCNKKTMQRKKVL